MPCPGLGSISAIIHMLAKGPEVARANTLMRILGTILLSLLLCLSLVGSVSADDSALLLSSISLSSASVTEGGSLQGTVTLSAAAPSDGIAVTLAADPSDAAVVPATVVVPAGATTATFKVSTRAASSVTVYGNYGVTKSESLSVMPRVSIDQVVDRVIERERAVVAQMQHMHPLAETYIQNLKSDHDALVVPASDQYFLGRLDMSDGVEDQLFEKETGLKLRALNPFPSLFARKFLPIGLLRWSCSIATSKKITTILSLCGRSSSAKCAALCWMCNPKTAPAAGFWEGFGLKTVITTSCASMEPILRIHAIATTCILIAGA